MSAALCGVLAACQAIDWIIAGEARNAFCAIRPPGHHCGADGTTAVPEALMRRGPKTPGGGPVTDRCGQGFCLLNNVA